MGNVYFFTGFPGFIAKQLLTGLLKSEHSIDEIYVLALPALKSKGEEWKQELLKGTSFSSDKFHVVTGDITKADLDLDNDIKAILKESVTHVFHLAAIYDLAVPMDIAYEVNVVGTDNVNNFLKTLSKLQRYVYFSTAYVAGRREGILLETELIRPHAFKNHYEETKFEAEVLVEKVKNELPVTIIRPGIVKGHSKTGETVKFDGPYFILNMLDRLRNMPIFPLIGSGQAVVNLVPVDFIVNAVLYLSHVETGIGKTYHLTDPRPYKVVEIYEMLLQELFGKKPKGKVPIDVAKLFLSLSKVRQFLRVEKEVLDYFVWLGQFDCSQATQDLQNAGISCPDLKDQIPSMVQFYLHNKGNKQFHIQVR